jgi:hypothetical protein
MFNFPGKQSKLKMPSFVLEYHQLSLSIYTCICCKEDYYIINKFNAKSRKQQRAIKSIIIFFIFITLQCYQSVEQ